MSDFKPTAATTPARRTTVRGELTRLVLAAMLAALSIVLGKYLQIPIGNSIRISFENLPILIAGIFFGPLTGGAVGVVADLVGCVMAGFTINPIITAGAALIGVLSGLTATLFVRSGRTLSPWVVYASVYIAHVVGSMVVKSIGLFVYYSTPLPVLLLRVPVYLAVGGLEGAVILLLARNKLFTGQLNRMLSRRKGSDSHDL